MHILVGVDTNFRVNRVLFATQELNARISDLTVSINSLEDERDKINHTFNIDVEMSESSAKSIGLV